MKFVKFVVVLVAIGFSLSYLPLYAGETGKMPGKTDDSDGESNFRHGYGMMREYRGFMGHDKEHFKRYGDRGYQMGYHMFRRGFLSTELVAILGLDDEQVEKIQAIESGYMKTFIQSEAELRIAEIELNELILAKEVNLDTVKEKTTLIGTLNADLKFFRYKTMEDVKNVLREDQKEKFRKLFGKYLGGSRFAE